MRRVALHLVWGCYGFWLPNDPRGSWSRYVGSRAVYDVGGEATTVNGTRSYAKDRHDRGRRVSTKAALKDPPVRLTGVQAKEAALGLLAAAADIGLPVHALCVMPDHLHAVVTNLGEDAKLMIKRLKAGATMRMNAAGPAPRPGATPWVRGGWFVPLFGDDDVRRAVRYVEDNPAEIGLRRQRWTGVIPWRGASG